MNATLRRHTLVVLCAALVLVNAVVLLALRSPLHAQSVRTTGAQFRAIQWNCPSAVVVGKTDPCVLAAEQEFRKQTNEGWDFVTFITPPGLLIFRSR
jgi:hypothetical protein